MTLIKHTVEEQKPPPTNIYKVLVGALVVFIIIMSIRTCTKNASTEKQHADFINSMSDSLKLYKNKDSDNVATISILKSFSASDFSEINFKDSQINELQKIVNYYKDKLKVVGSSVTIAQTETKFRNKIKTPFPLTYDSIGVIYHAHDSTYLSYGNNSIVISGVPAKRYVLIREGDNLYHIKYKNEWINYDMGIGVDSTSFDLKVTNKYATILKYDKGKPYVDVINYNPYSETTVLRSYLVSIPKSKNWGVGFSVGVGISTNLTPKPYIGIGVNYNILKF